MSNFFLIGCYCILFFFLCKNDHKQSYTTGHKGEVVSTPTMLPAFKVLQPWKTAMVSGQDGFLTGIPQTQQHIHPQCIWYAKMGGKKHRKTVKQTDSSTRTQWTNTNIYMTKSHWNEYKYRYTLKARLRSFAVGGNETHPTQKPILLISYVALETAMSLHD